jgi:hypothetical protein
MAGQVQCANINQGRRLRKEHLTTEQPLAGRGVDSDSADPRKPLRSRHGSTPTITLTTTPSEAHQQYTNNRAITQAHQQSPMLTNNIARVLHMNDKTHRNTACLSEGQLSNLFSRPPPGDSLRSPKRPFSVSVR